MEIIKGKKLIINADDAGLSDDINKAVRRGFQEKVVTSSSIMACGEAFKQATEMFHVMGKNRVGAHLTLTGSLVPCCSAGDVPSLTENGKFRKDYQVLLSRYMGEKINMDEVTLEFAAQINKIKKEGLTVSHIDSHEHIHLFPGILDRVISLARENNIRYIRFPVEPGKVLLKEFRAKDLLRYSALKIFLTGVKKKLRDNGLICNDHFWGHFHSGRLNGEILKFIVKNLKPGVNELCVHPAYASGDLLERHPWYKNGNIEIESLIDEKFKDILTAEKIELITPDETGVDA